MPYIVKADLKTHLYSENVEEISRGDDSIITRAINSGIAEVKSYLSRYDLDKLFNPDAVGYVPDENLRYKTLDVIAWHLVRLANPNVNLDLMSKMYDDAIKWLKEVQKGNADPEGWPYKIDDTNTDYPEGGSVSMISNIKRTNHY